MKTKTNTRSVVSASMPAAIGSGFTLGLDLGDRQHHVCVLDAAGQILHEGPQKGSDRSLTQNRRGRAEPVAAAGHPLDQG